MQLKHHIFCICDHVTFPPPPAAVSQIECDAWVKALQYLMKPENFETRYIKQRSEFIVRVRERERERERGREERRTCCNYLFFSLADG